MGLLLAVESGVGLAALPDYLVSQSNNVEKVLNKSKGRAVWSPRAQVDKIQYAKLVSNIIYNLFMKINSI